ncbi:MAG TPA: hypothetical protein VMB19_14740, partial [Silvibacterium sp.]|nr:hypothetical protein [Silvibacterium sp.]
MRAMDTAGMDISAIKQSMAETNELFNTEVFGKRNFEALDRIYTSDARVLPPGRLMVTGRQEIKGFWFDIIRSYNAKSAVLCPIDVIPAG